MFIQSFFLLISTSSFGYFLFLIFAKFSDFFLFELTLSTADVHPILFFFLVFSFRYFLFTIFAQFSYFFFLWHFLLFELTLHCRYSSNTFLAALAALYLPCKFIHSFMVLNSASHLRPNHTRPYQMPHTVLSTMPHTVLSTMPHTILSTLPEPKDDLHEPTCSFRILTKPYKAIPNHTKLV